MSSEVTFEDGRRRFLRRALTASTVFAVVSRPSARSLIFGGPVGIERHFAPVKVVRNRIIREVVGLRPFRPGGFVVDGERVGEKLLVHNYGHGGAGMTLSWGTAFLALNLARDFLQSSPRPDLPRRRATRASPVTNRRRFAVLGCGVSGLSTARLLQRQFQSGSDTVTIYTKNLPPETTSNISGALWFPSTVYDSEKATVRFTEQFQKACEISHREFQILVGNDYGISWIENYDLLQHEESLNRELPGGRQLYPETQIHRDPANYFGFSYVRQFSTMIIEPNVYLSALLRDFYIAGGKVVVREFHNQEEIARLPESVIFNCTGLGARDLFNDQELIPVRGQLEVLLPQPEIDYCYRGGGTYMFPRRDGIILGGTWDHEDWTLQPNPEQTTQILEAHMAIMRGLKQPTA